MRRTLNKVVRGAVDVTVLVAVAGLLVNPAADGGPVAAAVVHGVAALLAIVAACVVVTLAARLVAGPVLVPLVAAVRGITGEVVVSVRGLRAAHRASQAEAALLAELVEENARLRALLDERHVPA